MMRDLRPAVFLAACLLAAGTASAQTAKSAPLAKELTALLDQKKLDSLGTKTADGRFVAALYFPGTQLLVVSAKYSAPALLEQTLSQKAYREAYQELQGAGVRDSKVFITDLGADGLRPKPGDGQGSDTYVTSDTARTTFDGDPKKQKLTDEEYQKRFDAADDSYSSMLQALTLAARGPS